MNPPRPIRHDPAIYQPSRNPPPAKSSAPGNVMMYNPNQYNQGFPPANGSWAPPRQQPPLQQQPQQQQQAPPPPNQESWDWDENVNNFQSYPEPSQTTPMVPRLQNVPPANPTMYSVPDYSLTQPVPSYQPEHTINNNQYDTQAPSSNQNWGWNEGEDWGWGNEFQQQTTQQPQSSHPQLPVNQVENQQSANYQSMPPPPVNSGLETGFSSLSLSNQAREDPPQGQEQPQQPPWAQQQAPAQPEESNWSRVPTWGSALDHEQSPYEPGPESSYPRELGERNTFADGASFTDPSQSLPPPLSASLGNDQGYAPSALIQPIQSEQQNIYGGAGGRSMHPPPSTLNLGTELARVSPTPLIGSSIDQIEPSSDSIAVEPGTLPSLSAQRINSGPSYGSTAEGFSGPTGMTFNSSEFPAAPPVGGVPISTSDLSIGNRLPGSGSRSQSGTPSMERESERPDAEGGYENDQPTPLFSQPASIPYVAMTERKMTQESPSGSRPSSRQAGSTPSSETPSANPSPYHLPGDGNAFVRPKPVSGGGSFYPVATTSHVTAAAPLPSAVPTVARGSQEAVGSEFGPPVSAVPLSRAENVATSSSMLPPSSQRMIPGSGSQPPLLSMVPTPQQQQLQPQSQPRPAGTVTPVSEQRIVTGFAKNDPVPATPVVQTAPLLVTAPQGPPPMQQVEEVRAQSVNRSPPPPHRSETIGSENPRANLNSGTAPTGGTAGGNGTADRSDDRISSERDRDREIKPHDRGSRVERDRDRDDYDREGRNRYPDDDEDERFSTSYRERDRRYDGERDRDRDHRDPRRYDDRDRAYNRQDYDDDRRSGYGPSDRDRTRDPRRRDTRRSEYYLTDAELYERSGGRRSSLYEGDNNDPAGDFNRSAYGFNTSRDGRRRDNDRSRIDDRYYPSSRDISTRAGAEVPERANSERDYRHSASSGAGGRRRDPRDLYYQQDPRYYGYSARDAAYDPYRTGGYHHSAAAAAAAYNQQMLNYNQQINHALKYNYALFEELRLKNPAAYSEWYRSNYAQRYTPTVVTGGTGTALGSIAASEADRASVHSGRSSVNEDHPSMLANHSISQQLIRGSTTGLDQSHAYDYSLYQDEDNTPLTTQIRPTQDMTPHKFSCPHVIARFSPGGILLRVLPNSPKDGVAAHIELHDLNALLGDLPTAQEMKFFPGPLVPGQTHKQQVAVFCQQKIRRAADDANQLVDRQSYVLLWELLLLLLRQNGTIVGTDIAELLLKDHEILREPVVVQETPENGVETVTVAADRTLVSRQTEASVTKKFRELLLFGNKKEALEWAMTQGLWGHALFLASKMDQRTYSSVMIRFANGLALTDPLQTLYQLMSGRQPTAVTSCGDDKWGDWRPHLAMILSNSTSKSGNNSSELDKKSIVTLGDTLSARGFLLAAHFCYLVAQVEFGNYSNKASKLVLLSSSSSLSFEAFATNEAIQCTEVYEYARQLAAPEFMIPSFQSYKFLYATRLAEYGRPAEALQYCEAVGNVLAKSASTYSPSFIDQVYQLGSMLKYSDPQFLTENDGTSLGDPSWLTGLETAIKAAQADYSPVIGTEKLTFEQQQQPTEPESLPPTSTDYSSYQQQPHGGQYGDQQQNAQQQQQQQQYYNPTTANVQQQPYYDPQSSGQQQLQQQNYSEDSHVHQQQQPSEPESNPYSSIAGQDYNSYGSSQYNPSYSWQQPQQQQQPWNHGEMNAANGAVTDYWNPSNNNLSATSADEDAGPTSYSEPSYFNPASGSSAELKQSSDDKTSGSKQESGGGSNSNKAAAAAAARAQQAGSGGSWLGGFFSKFKPKTQMKLPDDKNPTIVWDAKKGQWVDTGKDSEDEAAALAPPPKDASFQSLPPMTPMTPSFSSPAPLSFTAAPTASNHNNNEGNRFGLNKGRVGRGGRNAYVNPSNIKISSVNSPLPLLDPFPAATPSLSATGTPQFFVPSPAMIDTSSAPVDFVSSPAQQPDTSSTTQGHVDSGVVGERFLYNPTQLATPAAVPSGRPGLASRGRYPR